MTLKQLLKQAKCWHNWKTIKQEIVTGTYTDYNGMHQSNHYEYYVIKRKCVYEIYDRTKIFKS